MAFRLMDAEPVDDDLSTRGSPNDICLTCGNYWIATRHHVGIYLEKDTGGTALPLAEDAKFFFSNGPGQGMRVPLKATYFEEWGLFVLQERRDRSRPPAADGIHPAPRIRPEQAILRIESGKASFDIRMNRFRGHDGSLTDGVDDAVDE